MLTYLTCSKVIANGTYGEYDDMMMKLDVFLLNNRFTQEQYNDLVTQLQKKEGMLDGTV